MFGPEGPVQDKALAEARAAVCAGVCAAGAPQGKPCPKNQPGDWLSYFTVPVSNALRAALAALKGQGLSTTRDDDLHVCAACDCPLKLKVWARLDHILAHIPPESKAGLVDNCWIRTEGKDK
jgi:hypothetical protein